MCSIWDYSFPSGPPPAIVPMRNMVIFRECAPPPLPPHPTQPHSTPSSSFTFHCGPTVNNFKHDQHDRFSETSLTANLGSLGLGRIWLPLGVQLRLGPPCRQAVLLQVALQLPAADRHVQGLQISRVIRSIASCTCKPHPPMSFGLCECIWYWWRSTLPYF